MRPSIFSEDGSFTRFRFTQLRNARSPITVTPSGMLTSSRLVQFCLGLYGADGADGVAASFCSGGASVKSQYCSPAHAVNGMRGER